MSDIEAFEACRPGLLALSYRMLGDVGRAEDLVQETWLRWQQRAAEVDAPKAYLTKTIMHLCLNELTSARTRHEQSRGDRLPEPVDLSVSPLGRIEAIEQVSMAFLVLLQRLTAAERAVLLLSEVFDFSHKEVAALLGKSEQACRQLLKRAREHVAAEKRGLTVSRDEHRRLLSAFLAAAAAGRIEDLAALLVEDAVLIVDAGSDGGHFGRVRNLPGPVVGAHKVAAFVAAVTPQGAAGSSVQESELNGQPAAVVMRDGRPYAAILLSVADGRIRRVFIHADPGRLGHVSAHTEGPEGADAARTRAHPKHN